MPEQLKTLTSSKYHSVQHFFLKLRTRFLLTNVYKMVFGIFLILFRSWVICRNKKRPCFYTLVFINNSKSKQNKRNSERDFEDIVKLDMCVKFQQKILNIVVVGARQSFQFPRQISWFLGNNRTLPKFRYQILYNLISITKL